tara:strand:+ start:156 stop:1934 length:1779 start_codon:yes stop_codon:yes gene_type:complete
MLRLKLIIATLFALFLVEVAIAESNLNQIVVTPSKRPTTIFNSLNSIEVVTQDDIKKYGYRTIDEILNLSSSISIGSNGGLGQTKSIFLRGTESNHTKVLLNGVELNPGTLGVPSIQHISVEMINRIEIAKGGMSTLYGRDSIGGVINIITKQHDEKLANELMMSSGSFNTNKINFFKTFSKNFHNFSINYSNTWSNSFKAKVTSTKNHTYNNENLNLNYGYSLNNSRFEVNYYQSDGNTEYDSSGSNLSQDHKDSHIKTSWMIENKDSITKVIFIDKQNKIDQAAISATDFTHTKVNQFSIEKNYFDLLDTNSIFGFTYTDEALYEASYGTAFRTSHDTKEIFFHSEYLPTPEANINFGSRYINHPRYGYYLVGDINVGYLVKKNLYVTAGIGKSFRPPDGTDLLGYGGNQNLKPEKSISSEISLKYQLSNNNHFIISLFNNNINNLIESDGSIMQNINKARITGMDLSYNNTYKAIDFLFNYTYQEADDVTNDTSLSRRPRNKITGKLSHSLSSSDKISFTMIGESKRDNSIYDYHRLGGYLLFNVNYLHEFDNYRISIKANNILNKSYQKAHDYNIERATIYISLTTNL